MARRFESVMRRSLLLAIVLAIVAAPMAFAGTGLCRSMPCCPPNLAAAGSQMQQPDCCNTTSCDQRPDAASEYTKTNRVDHQHVHSMTVAVAIAPLATTSGPPRATWDALPAVESPSLHRRIAILSVFLI